MTLEESHQCHEQWLRSIESNLNQVSSDLSALTRHQEQIAANLAEVTRNQALFTATFAQAMARLTGEQERVAQNQDRLDKGHAEVQAELHALAEANRKLAETVDRYIRFRGDGQQQN